MDAEPMECDPYKSKDWDLYKNYPRLEKSARIAAIVYMTEEPKSHYGRADYQRLKIMWKRFGFDVRELKDPTRQGLINWIRALAKEINAKNMEHDAFNFAFIGHGMRNEGACECEHMELKEEPGKLPKHNIFHVNALIEFFVSECQALISIPKFFLWQCCRGNRKEYPVTKLTASGVSPMTDIYCLYGSPPGFVSWYDKDTGRSYLVDTVCEVFLNNYQKQDLKTMTTAVVEKIKQIDIDGYRQTPFCSDYGFTKLLYFNGVGGTLRDTTSLPSQSTGIRNYTGCSAARLQHELDLGSSRDKETIMKQENELLEKNKRIQILMDELVKRGWDPNEMINMDPVPLNTNVDSLETRVPNTERDPSQKEVKDIEGIENIEGEVRDVEIIVNRDKKMQMKEGVENLEREMRDLEIIVKQAKIIHHPPTAYKMDSSPRGTIFIANYSNFDDGKRPRKGSERDVENVKELFQQMGFQPTVMENATKDKTMEEMLYFSKSDKHYDADSMALVVMSHGNDQNSFLTSDGEFVTHHEVYELFSDDNCPALKGKPKIFIFVHCRKKWSAHSLTRGSKYQKTRKRMYMSDTFVVHSALPGGSSFRHIKYGSLFIHHLCQVLMEKSYESDFSDLMDVLTNKSYNYKSDILDLRAKVMIEEFQVRKDLYFNPTAIKSKN